MKIISVNTHPEYEKLITDFPYPRLHLQNRGLKIYRPISDVNLLRGNNG